MTFYGSLHPPAVTGHLRIQGWWRISNTEWWINTRAQPHNNKTFVWIMEFQRTSSCELPPPTKLVTTGPIARTTEQLFIHRRHGVVHFPNVWLTTLHYCQWIRINHWGPCPPFWARAGPVSECPMSRARCDVWCVVFDVWGVRCGV